MRRSFVAGRRLLRLRMHARRLRAAAERLAVHGDELPARRRGDLHRRPHPALDEHRHFVGAVGRRGSRARPLRLPRGRPRRPPGESPSSSCRIALPLRSRIDPPRKSWSGARAITVRAPSLSPPDSASSRRMNSLGNASSSVSRIAPARASMRSCASSSDSAPRRRRRRRPDLASRSSSSSHQSSK